MRATTKLARGTWSELSRANWIKLVSYAMSDLAGESPTELILHAGEPIVPEDSFLRRLPLALDAEQRMRIEALVFISDGLNWSYSTLRALALKCVEQDGVLSLHDRSALFAAAWSIIDHLDAARQMIPLLRSADPGPKTRQLLAMLEPVRSLRNSLRHLNQNIAGLTSAKGFRTPMFGVFSFFYVPPGALGGTPGSQKVLGGRAYSICAGSLGPNELVPLPMPQGEQLDVPVGLFRLSAFQLAIEVGPIIVAFAGLMRHLAPSIEEAVGARLAEHSKQTGTPIDELSVAAPDGLVLVAHVEFLTADTAVT